MNGKTAADDPWMHDLLARKDDAEFLTKFLSNRIEERRKLGKTASYVLNIDAPYGEGKTFFLTGLYKQLKDKHPVVYFNAWRSDHADTPLLALISEVEEALRPYVSKRASRKAKTALKSVMRTGLAVSAALAKGAALQLGRRYLGEGLEAAREALSGDDQDGDVIAQDEAKAASESAVKQADKIADKALDKLLDRFRAESKSIERFKTDLASLISSIHEGRPLSAPLFVLVDELDRCRPTYAVTLLEQVKHLFDVDGSVFVIATDTDQLRAVVKAVYGADFGSGRYLRRFFDRTYTFPEPDRSDFVAHLFAGAPLSVEANGVLGAAPQATFLAVMNAFDMKLRDFEQCYDLLRVIGTTWPYKTRIELVYMLPLIATLHADDRDAFASWASGRPTDPPRSWHVDYFTGPDNEQKQASVKAIAVRVLEQINSPLYRIQSRGNDMVDRFVHQVFADEFQRQHNNRYTVGSDAPMSVLRDYPGLVQSAGRLRAQSAVGR